MKKILTKIIPLSLAFLLMVQVNIFAQKDGKSRDGITVICPISGEDGHSRIGPPAGFLDAYKRGRVEGTATFEVTYEGFPDDGKAKEAFQYVIDIWSTLIVSDQVIHVTVEWGEREFGVLASAGATSFQRDFEGAPRTNTWYPIALANKLAGKDLDTDAGDIRSTVNSAVNWYLGIDGNTPSGQYDFVSTMLHEVGHGLGFIGTYNVENGVGGTSSLPAIYDLFMENGGGESIVYGPYENNSRNLGRQLTTGNLYFNSQLSMENGEIAKLYSPFSFNQGSSIYHLDDAKYPASANSPHALMTHAAGTGESIHSLGSIAAGMFADMGWISTAIFHNPITVAEDGTSISLTAIVKSDTTLVTDSLKLHYSLDGFVTEEPVIDRKSVV